MAVTGGLVIKARLRLMRANVNRTIDEAMNDLAEQILKTSNDFAPQDTGQMIQNSGVDSDDSRALARFRRSVFYKEDYAPIQHEGFIRGKPIQPGLTTAAKPAAGPKFLSRAFALHARRGIRNVARKVERTLRFTLR